MYVVVSYTRANGHVIRPGLSLVQAYHLIARLGHGAIFRSEGMSVYARPVYPRLPRPAPRGREALSSTSMSTTVSLTQGKVA